VAFGRGVDSLRHGGRGHREGVEPLIDGEIPKNGHPGRELGKSPRWGESIALLAATIARFDLVSVVELRDNLEDLRRILACLGPRWRAVFSDYRLDAGGNRERVGFLHNTSRVSFTGLASHAEAERVREGDEYTLPVPEAPRFATAEQRQVALARQATFRVAPASRLQKSLAYAA